MLSHIDVVSYNNNMKKFKKGFTIGELLVTIAIAGILSTIAFTSLKGFRENARIESALLAASSVIAPGNECMDKRAILDPDKSTPVVGELMCAELNGKWPSFEDTKWDWWYTETNTFNNTFSVEAYDTTSATGCITCTNFACSEDYTADCPPIP